MSVSGNLCHRIDSFSPPSDANAQLALLQFISTSLPRVRIPTSVHTDHLITARHGAKADLAEAEKVNREVYAFLKSACDKVGRTPNAFYVGFGADVQVV